MSAGLAPTEEIARASGGEQIKILVVHVTKNDSARAIEAATHRFERCLDRGDAIFDRQEVCHIFAREYQRPFGFHCLATLRAG